MDDVTHVRLIDAHAEGVSCHDDRSVVVDPCLLIGAALFFSQSCVIARCLHAGLHQVFVHLLDVFARIAIHHA